MNLLTDVAGLTVGQAQDEHLASGVTVVLFDEPAVAGVAVLGGAPAGRDQECLVPDRTVERVDALVLSGGSGFGLDATTGVQAWLREHGRGIAIRDVRIPIAPTAIQTSQKSLGKILFENRIAPHGIANQMIISPRSCGFTPGFQSRIQILCIL